MEELAAGLLIWILNHSIYSVTSLKPPPIEILSPSAMTELYRTEVGAASDSPKVHGYFRLEGPSAGTIYLIDPDFVHGAERFAFPVDNPIFHEHLLHELVHYVQWSAGAYARFDCPARGESAAYILGGRYLRQQGVADPMPNRELWAKRLSRC